MRIFMLVQHPDARGPVGKHTLHLVAALRSLGCSVVTHLWGQRKRDESLLARLTRLLRDLRSMRGLLRTTGALWLETSRSCL
jgi:hypothetical protein